MTIKQKIVGKSLATSLLVAAMGMLSALSMLRIGDSLRTVITTALRETLDADQLEGAAARIDHGVDEYGIVMKDRQGSEALHLKAEIDAAFEQVIQATSHLDQAVGRQPVDVARNSADEGNARADRSQLELIKQQARRSSDLWSQLSSNIGSDRSADAALLDRLTLATGTLMKDSLDFEHEAKDDITHGLLVAQTRVTTSVRLLTAAAAMAILLVITLALLVAIPLTSRLARLRDGTVQVGKGNLDARIDVESGDEIGQLATAFNEMAAGLRRSRDEIRENESKFRELADTIHEVFWVSDPKSTKLQYVSPAYEEIWGRSCESVYQDLRSFAEAIVPQDRPRVLAALEKAATDGIDQQYRIVRPDGTMRWIHDRGFPVRDETGKVQRLVGIAADVTKQRMAEDAVRQAHAELESRVEARTAELQRANEALRRSETDLQRAKDAAESANRAKSVVFDTALDAIVTMDSRSIITEWNLQAETMFRWDRTEVIGTRLDQTIIAESQWNAHQRGIEEFVKTGNSPLLEKVAELVACRRDGRQFPVEIAITPAWTGTECTFTAFIRDITVRKQAEADLRQARDAAESASRTKSEFLANMSHEIRTPLNGVIGMSGLLLDTELNEKQRRFAELIKLSGSSLAELINDLLDFSKIEARKLEIESIDFDVYAAVEEVIEMMSIKASQKGLDLACLTMPEVPRLVKGDSQRVKQILINLVNNAIKFTESGSISLRLTLEERTQEYITVRFAVTDTGIGIPADRMDRLFKSFSQLDSSTTRTYGGTGLGLAISKQLAELMGGGIGVESTAGRGSTFWFTLRLGPGSQSRQLVPTTAGKSGHWRVLAADASPMMRETLRSQLSCWGLEAAVASSADEAMEMLIDAAGKACPYDVAILDGELPDINTLELGKAIKARREVAGTVLLILSPIGSDLEPLKLRAAGFSGHLVKPVRQSRLYDAIVDAMNSTPQSKQIAGRIPPVTDDSPGSVADGARRTRILVAEDNRVNQIVASEILAKHGYACDIVDNGRKAIAAVLKGGYDLVLMDCLMPEIDGFEATRQIRQAEEADSAKPRRHTPIIALTANAINGDREHCLQAGMDDYVSKPIDPHQLHDAIQKLLEKSSAISAAEPATAAAVVAANTPSAIAYDLTPPLVIEALLDRCMGNAETVTSILDEFERQAVSDLAELNQHVQSGDCEGTARVAHTLKGASGILSADALSDVAFKLERMGRAGVLTEADQLLIRLNDEVHRCIDYLPTARAAIAGSSNA